jgi:Protein of unknown function (DUF2934)
MRHKTASVSTAKPDKSSLELTEELIRVRAYQLYEERDCKGGHHLEDWLRVEAEIVGKKTRCCSERTEPQRLATMGTPEILDTFHAPRLRG